MIEIAAESDTLTRVRLAGREIVLVGTAHVSRESVDQVRTIIQEEQPDRICVEIDQGRYNSLTQKSRWENLNLVRVIKQGQGFLMLVNLVLNGFQRRLGADLGVSPGEEMMAAISVAQEQEIPFSLCDREIQVTLRRAWSKTNLWGKSKLLASLISAGFSNEEFSEEEIERLKEKSALHGMMEDLADFLPQAKEVLIDERDRYLASKIFEAEGKKLVAVVGAGHVPGILQWFETLEKDAAAADVEDIAHVPPPGIIRRVLPYLIPLAVVGLIGFGFYRSGFDAGMTGLLRWIIINAAFSGVGAIMALAHPLTILLSALAAPLTSMNPTIGVGMVSGVLEAVLRKPRVRDFSSLQDDVQSVRGFYRNRITRVLLVFLFTSVGSSIATFIALPLLFPAAVA